MPRQTYTVTFPDGHRQSFDGPTGMSDADLVQRAQQERKFAGGDIPTSFAGGATRHLLEQEPQTVNALLSGVATASGAGAPFVAGIPLVTSGVKHLSQLLATGHTDDPSLGGLAGDLAEGAVMGYGGQALGATARGVGAAKNAVAARLPSWVRAVSSLSPKKLALDAATSPPVLGAVERLGGGLTPDGVRSAFRRVVGGLTPGVEAEAAPAATGFQGLEVAAQRRGSLAALERQARPSTTGAMPTAAVPDSSYPQWLARLEAEATPPPRPPGFGAPSGTGAVGGPAIEADYPAWLDRLASEASEASPPPPTPPRPPGFGAPSGTGAVGGPAIEADYPAWLDRLASEATPPPAPVPPTPPPPAAAPSTRGLLPAWMRSSRGTSFAPVSAAETEAALTTAGQPAASEGAAAIPTVSEPAPSLQSLERAATPPGAAPVEAAVADAGDAGGSTVSQPSANQAQFAQFTPAARAARAAARAAAAPAENPAADAAARRLLETPSFQALAGTEPVVADAVATGALPATEAAAGGAAVETGAETSGLHPSIRRFLESLSRGGQPAEGVAPTAAADVAPSMQSLQRAATPTPSGASAAGEAAADLAPISQAEAKRLLMLERPGVTTAPTPGEHPLLDAMHQLNWQVRKGALVDTADLRQAVADTYPGSAFDRAMYDLARQGKIQMQTHAWPGRLTDADKLQLIPNGRGGWFDAVGYRLD